MNAPRRAFLQGLASLPLIGGGVTLIGRPTGVAEPATPFLLQRYLEWLRIECGECLVEREGWSSDRFTADRMRLTREWCQHNLTLNPHPERGHFLTPPGTAPSTRAALVLSAVDCDWRGQA